MQVLLGVLISSTTVVLAAGTYSGHVVKAVVALVVTKDESVLETCTACGAGTRSGIHGSARARLSAANRPVPSASAMRGLFCPLAPGR